MAHRPSGKRRRLQRQQTPQKPGLLATGIRAIPHHLSQNIRLNRPRQAQAGARQADTQAAGSIHLQPRAIKGRQQRFLIVPPTIAVLVLPFEQARQLIGRYQNAPLWLLRLNAGVREACSERTIASRVASEV